MREKNGVLSWLPTVVGVCALVLITIVAIARLTPRPEQQQTALPEPAFSLPGTTAGPQVPVSLFPADSASAEPSPTSVPPRRTRATAPPAATTAPRTTVPPPAPPTTAAVTVTAGYSVLSSFGDSFIGQVRLTNVTAEPRDWTVVLIFPSNVGGLRAFWVDGLQQPTLRQSGRTFTWTSTVPLAARSTAGLRFDFSRSGSGDTPSTCEANGSRCS